MSRRQDLKDFFEKISLAQRISSKDKAFVDYSGADTEISLSLAFFNTMIKHGILESDEEGNPTDPTIGLLMDLLKEQSKAVLASSPTTDIFTKLGFRVPKSERVLDFADKPSKSPVEPTV